VERSAEDAKKVFKEVSLQFQDKYGIASNDIDIEEGVPEEERWQLVPFPDEEAQKWAKAADPSWNDTLRTWRQGLQKADVEGYVKFVQERILSG